MAKIQKLTKNGQVICPATRMDAVVHPDLKVAASELIGEVNVSRIFPTGGIDGTNKYTLEGAIAKIPESLRRIGIKCSFLDEGGELEVWEYEGGFWDSSCFANTGIVGLANRGIRLLDWEMDADTTRQQVPFKERKKGMLVIFHHPIDGYVIEQSVIEDDNQIGDARYWGKDVNWRRLLVCEDYGRLSQQDKDYFYMQNELLHTSILLNRRIISSDGVVAESSNGLQNIYAFNVEDIENIYLNMEANNYYAPFYAFAFSEKGIDEIGVGTVTLADQRPELTPKNSDFVFSGLLSKPKAAKTLLVQETNGKADTIKVYSLLKDRVKILRQKVDALTPMEQTDITSDLLWREKVAIRSDTTDYAGDSYAYSILSYAAFYDKLKVVLPDGYAVKIRGRFNPELLSENSQGEYVLSEGNKCVEINLYLTDNSQTLTAGKAISDGVRIYGISTAESDAVNLACMQRRALRPTWMGYDGYTIANGKIVALANGRQYCRIFGVKVTEGKYYRVKFDGYGNMFEDWASYAFFGTDYKENPTALCYDCNPSATYCQIDVVKKAPAGSKYLMFCVNTDESVKSMISKYADIAIEEYTDIQSAIALACHQGIAQSMYNAGASALLSKAKDVGIIVAGQSNVAGRCPAKELPDDIVDENRQIPYCNLRGTLSVNGNGTDDNAFNGIYTLQSVWAFDAIVYRKLSDKLQKDFYVAKYAIGDTAITDYLGTARPCWQPDINKITTAGKQPLMLKLRETIEAVLAAHANTEFKAVLWHQGEGDMQSVDGAFDYYENFKSVIWYIRGVVGNPNLPFIFGTISHKSMQYSSMIEDAQKRVAEEDPNVYCVDMSGAELLDDYHFNGTWSEHLGNEMWKILEPLIDASVTA